MLSATPLRASIVVALLLVAGCGWFSKPRVRTLPAAHDTPVVYVALGDSTVEGIGASNPGRNYVSRLHARLRQVYPQARVANLGMAGATSDDVVTGQLREAVALRPQLVTVSIGPNDVTERVSVEAYGRNLGTIFATLTRDTAAVLVVNLLPDLAVTPRFRSAPERDAVGRQSARFNEVLTRQAQEYGAEVIDLYSASRREVPQRPELVARDGYHPSDVGYERWAQLMWQGVERRLAR